jgi:RNA polymerase sigma factor FliA
MSEHGPESTRETPARSDVEARVRDHMQLVFRTARHHWERLGRRVDYEELVTEGALAVLKAAERHDDRRAPFSLHARRRLMWAMKDVARRRLGRTVDVTRGAASCTGVPLGDGGRRLAAVDPDAACTGWFLEGKFGRRSLEPTTPSDIAISERMNPEDEAARHEILEQLQVGIGALDQAAQHLIERHYFDGERFCVIAIELGMSTFAVCRLHRRALLELRRAMVAADSGDGPAR